jgi:hypothetical protein
MKKFNPQQLITKFASGVLAGQHRLTLIYQWILLRYCTTMSPLVTAMGKSFNLLSESMISETAQLISVYKQKLAGRGLTETESQLHQPSGWGSGIVIARIVVRHPRYVLGLSTLFSSATLLKVGHNSISLAANLCITAVKNDKTRFRSLADILRNSQSPLYTSEIVIWLFTRSSHIEDVLGDFRETYEALRTNHGEARARRWSRQQTAREVWNGAKATTRIVMWVKTVWHMMARHHGKQ